MSTRKKIIIAFASFLGLVLLAGIFLVPWLIDIDRYRGEVVARIQQVSGRPAEIGRLALTLFPTLSVRADEFVLGNPAGFPRGYMLRVRKVNAELDAHALLQREILIKSLDLDQAYINLLTDGRGHWNFDSAPKEKILKTASAQEKPLFSLNFVAHVSISQAQVTAANLLPSGRPAASFFEGRDVSCELKDVNLAAFTASNDVGAPLAVWPTRSSPPALNVFRASMVFAASSEKRPTAQGTLRADLLRFGTLQATSVRTRLRLYPRLIFLDDLKFDFYGGRGKGDISFDFARQNPLYTSSAKLSGVDVHRLLEAFPDARGKMTGKLDGNLKFAGEVTRNPDAASSIHGTGQVNVRDGDLPTLQLNKNLMALTRLGNLGASTGSPSSFSSITADINIANQRITSNKVTIVGNGYYVDASGSLGLAGQGNVDYQGMAKLAAGQGPITDLLTNLSGVTYADGKLNFPFKMTGTLQKPRFTLNPTKGGSSVGGAGNPGGSTPAKGAALQPGRSQQERDILVKGVLGLLKRKPSGQPQQQPQQPQP